jgi:hypothetical protein
MATFPILNSGSVTQYPATAVWNCPGEAIYFLDGTDQRYSLIAQPLRRWLIDLHLLNETELANFDSFFQLVSGEGALFDFTDPFSGTTVQNCRLASPGLVSEYQATNVGATSFWVIETNG